MIIAGSNSVSGPPEYCSFLLSDNGQDTGIHNGDKEQLALQLGQKLEATGLGSSDLSFQDKADTVRTDKHKQNIYVPL